MKAKVYTTDSARQTQKKGEEFAKGLRRGEFIALFGELGAGKTTFVQGLVKGLGIKKRIISPTFIILRKYKIPRGLKFFYHIDLYRIKGSKKVLEGIGFNEITGDKKNIIAVEWAEKIEKLLPGRRWDIRLEHISEKKRRIEIEKINE